MKNIVSLLAVAALAITIGAGCGKHTKCDQATTETECKDAKKFEETVKCKWEKSTASGAKATDGKCVSTTATTTNTTTTTTPKTNDELCKEKSAGTQQECEAVVLDPATKKCKYDATATDKCTVAP